MFANVAYSAVQETNGGGGNGCSSDEYAGVVVSFVDEVVELAHLFGAYTACVWAELDEYLAAVRNWVGVGLSFFERGVFGFHGFGGDGGDCHSLATGEVRSYSIEFSCEIESIPREPIRITEFICKVLVIDFHFLFGHFVAL